MAQDGPGDEAQLEGVVVSCALKGSVSLTWGQKPKAGSLHDFLRLTPGGLLSLNPGEWAKVPSLHDFLTCTLNGSSVPVALGELMEPAIRAEASPLPGCPLQDPAKLCLARKLP